MTRYKEGMRTPLYITNVFAECVEQTAVGNTFVCFSSISSVDGYAGIVDIGVQHELAVSI